MFASKEKHFGDRLHAHLQSIMTAGRGKEEKTQQRENVSHQASGQTKPNHKESGTFMLICAENPEHGRSALVLEGHCLEEFSSHLNQTHHTAIF